MITLHHLKNSGSQKILWLLEEIGIPYEIKKYERINQGQAPPELAKIHPLGKAPVLEDGDIVLAESSAIIDYLITKYGAGRFTPSESQYIDDLYYTRYADGTLMPIYTHWLVFTIIPEAAPFFVRPIIRLMLGLVTKVLVDERMRANIDMLEAHLGKRPGKFIAGGDEPTHADFLMIFPLETFYTRPESGIGENIKAYVELVHERPAYKRGIEKGGPFDAHFHGGSV
ncbi:hypothetical protein FRC12_012815 [Ceratobasidium sp. 428]|nr:hypothetical protein FRC12_012815 [Ceratobasidium sp. 428]